MDGYISEKKCNIAVLILLMCNIFISNTRISFVISLVYFVYLLLKNRGRLFIPRIPGFRGYLVIIAYATVIGLMLYSVRNVFRDLYYILPTVTWILIVGQDDKDDVSLIKTLYLYGGIISVKCFLSFAISPSFDFGQMRSHFGICLYDVGFILPMMMYQVFICKQIIFSKKLDRFMIIMMSMQIMLCFGRIGIIQPLAMILIIILLSISVKNLNTNAYKVLAAFLFLAIFILFIFFYILPESLTGTFMDKFFKSFTEIDSEQTINSVSAAMNNWRGYEIQAAQEQWLKGNILVKLFGAGLGKGIELEYVPYAWVGIVDGKEIPLLHNGFYTLLPKGGVFAVICCLLMFLGPVKSGFKWIKHHVDDEEASYGIIIVSMSVAAILNTWVVRGPVQQGSFTVWAILLSHFYQMVSRKLFKSDI